MTELRAEAAAGASGLTWVAMSPLCSRTPGQQEGHAAGSVRKGSGLGRLPARRGRNLGFCSRYNGRPLEAFRQGRGKKCDLSRRQPPVAALWKRETDPRGEAGKAAGARSQSATHTGVDSDPARAAAGEMVSGDRTDSRHLRGKHQNLLMDRLSQVREGARFKAALGVRFHRND